MNDYVSRLHLSRSADVKTRLKTGEYFPRRRCMFNSGEFATKKSLIVLTMLGLSGVAMAQSSVTLYGVGDAGIGKIKAADSGGKDANDKIQMISGGLMNNGPSRVGFRGIEDLGGGLKVGFNFESGLDLDDGSTVTDTLWARQANIWIGGIWGTLKIGRQYTPSYMLQLNTYELTGTADYSVLGGTYKYLGIGARANSVFAYISPNFNGLSAEVAYITNNDCISTTVCGKSMWDAALMYAKGPVKAGLSIQKVQDSKIAYQFGGNYNFGHFILAASYNQAVQTGTPSVRRGFDLGGAVVFGPFSATLDVTRDTKNDWAGHKYTNNVLELKYALSKRTFVYGAYLRLDKTNNFGLGIHHNF